MKKKGFTLVELLAVIAILAILVIIALPNIMDLFNDAKYNSFKNEVKEIFKTAESQFLTDSMTSSTDKLYGNGDYTDTNCEDLVKPLSLSGRSNIQYGIVFNKKGEVRYYEVTDGTYVYSYKKPIALANVQPLTIERIGAGRYGSHNSYNYFATLKEMDKTSAEIVCNDNGNGFKLETE